MDQSKMNRDTCRSIHPHYTYQTPTSPPVHASIHFPFPFSSPFCLLYFSIWCSPLRKDTRSLRSAKVRLWVMMSACTAASVARTFPSASMCTRACTEGLVGSALLPPVLARADVVSNGALAWVSRSTEDTAPCCLTRHHTRGTGEISLV